jgi:hypothetical protein
MNRRHLLGFSALALTLGPTVLRAQDSKKPLHAEQLDQMLAPIALYPDALLSQTLMARPIPWKSSRRRAGRRPIPTSGDAAVPGGQEQGLGRQREVAGRLPPQDLGDDD